MSSSESESSPPGVAPDLAAEDNEPRKRRLWTKQEDERLRLLVSYWGDQGGRRSNWDKIAANFDGRTSKNCRKRWFHSLDPKLRRGKWNKNEDKILKEAYDQMGPAWQRIAQLIPGRTDDQCSKRYNDVLNPAVHNRLRPWTPEEDQLLQDLYAEVGPKWQMLATRIEGRTGLTIRNRWRKLNKPEKLEESPSLDHTGDLGTDTTDANTDPKINNNEMNTQRHDSLETSLTYDVPGAMPGVYPAGADMSWMHMQTSASATPAPQPPVANNPGNVMGYLSQGMVIPGAQRQYTITVDDPHAPPLSFIHDTHQHISSAHLDQIMDFALKNRNQIVIHQHIYQFGVQPSDMVNGSRYPVAVTTVTNVQQPYNGGAAPSVGRVVQPPVQPIHTNQLAIHPAPEQLHTGNAPVGAPIGPSMNPSMGQLNMGTMGNVDSTNSVPHAVPEIDERYPAPNQPNSVMDRFGMGDMGDSMRRQDGLLSQPPPDEFLSRPLLFEDLRGDSNQFDTDAIDFLAFNPS